jgi:hypothetical protein
MRGLFYLVFLLLLDSERFYSGPPVHSVHTHLLYAVANLLINGVHRQGWTIVMRILYRQHAQLDTAA